MVHGGMQEAALVDAPSELDRAHALFQQADDIAGTNPEKCASYLLEATPLLLTHFCRQEGMTPRESAFATVSCMQNIGISFELAVSACRRVGVPLTEDGQLREYDPASEPTPFDLNEMGWAHISGAVVDQWNACARDHMTIATCFSRTVTGCAEELLPFSPESQFMILRCAGLPVYSIADEMNQSSAQPAGRAT